MTPLNTDLRRSTPATDPSSGAPVVGSVMARSRPDDAGTRERFEALLDEERRIPTRSDAGEDRRRADGSTRRPPAAEHDRRSSVSRDRGRGRPDDTDTMAATDGSDAAAEIHEKHPDPAADPTDTSSAAVMGAAGIVATALAPSTSREAFAPGATQPEADPIEAPTGPKPATMMASASATITTEIATDPAAERSSADVTMAPPIEEATATPDSGKASIVMTRDTHPDHINRDHTHPDHIHPDHAHPDHTHPDHTHPDHTGRTDVVAEETMPLPAGIEPLTALDVEPGVEASPESMVARREESTEPPPSALRPQAGVAENPVPENPAVGTETTRTETTASVADTLVPGFDARAAGTDAPTAEADPAGSRAATIEATTIEVTNPVVEAEPRGSDDSTDGSVAAGADRPDDAARTESPLGSRALTGADGVADSDLAPGSDATPPVAGSARAERRRPADDPESSMIDRTGTDSARLPAEVVSELVDASSGPAPIADSDSTPASPDPLAALTGVRRADVSTSTAPAVTPPIVEFDGEVWEQVKQAVGLVRQRGDGRHEVSVVLRPGELGAVTVELIQRGDEVAVRIVTQTSAAQERLDQARLLADLASAGLGRADVDISHRDPGGRPGDRPPAGPPRFTSAGDPSSSPGRSDAGAGSIGRSTLATSGRGRGVDLAL